VSVAEAGARVFAPDPARLALAQRGRFAPQVVSSSSLAPFNLTRSGQRSAAGDPSPKARKMTLMDGDHAKARRRPRDQSNERFVQGSNRFMKLVRPAGADFHTVYAHNSFFCAHSAGENSPVHSQKVTLSRRDRATV
jgi:hypothetical protein